jgi:elongation factor G
MGILAHVDAGKTSITEKILHLAGLRPSEGAVDEGTTLTDYLFVERQHGITIKSAAVRFDWNDASIHLIDTPGHVDFGIEVERALRILDGAIIALCAVSGVQARTEVIAKSCAARSLPRIYFINKMDRNIADFPEVVKNLKSNLEPDAIALQYPIFEGRKWIGLIDLITQEQHIFEPCNDLASLEISEAKVARQLLVEKIADSDEEILALYAANQTIPSNILASAVARLTKTCCIVPVLLGSAFVDPSIALLLDSSTALLPSPIEAGVPGYPEIVASDVSPLAAFVFKTVNDPSGDIFAWTRIWSGTITTGKKIFDARSGREIKVKNLFGIHADTLIELKGAGAGDVVAIKTARIEAGVSLCDKIRPIVFEALSTPDPVVSQVLEPSTLQDMSAIRRALESLAVEDGSLDVKEERETGRFVISGQGELHLDIVAQRLKKEFGLLARMGNPRINCKEKLKKEARIREQFDRDFGGERVRTEVEVLATVFSGKGIHIETREGLRVHPQFLAASIRGATAAAGSGPRAGWPMDHLSITICEILPPSSGTGRNGEAAVEAATALAVRKALLQGGTYIMEPVMRVDVECPEDSFGAALSSITARGGRIESVEDRMSVKVLSARVPMRLLFGFSSDIRSLSNGRAQFQARLHDYEPMIQAIEP